jgi:hypothetical protein
MRLLCDAELTSSLSFGPFVSDSTIQSSAEILLFLDLELPMLASAQSSSAKFAFSICQQLKVGNSLS